MTYSKIFKRDNDPVRITVGQSELLNTDEIQLLNVEFKAGKEWVLCPLKYATQDEVYLTKLEYWLTLQPSYK